MKSKEVLALLRVTRPTLTKYVKNGTIKATLLPNGQYDYDDESVYAFINKDIERKTVLYCRVSTQKQMKLYSKRKVLKIKEALTEEE
ncbi:MAG: hypothetical protein MR691_07570 [Clostridium sp.]|nr:hypothetical protein [Clostridium sp.]